MRYAILSTTLVLLALGCVRVTITYRDVGVDAATRDAPSIDAPRPDAPPPDAPGMDAPVVVMDAPPPDAPRMDAPLTDVRADAIRAVLTSIAEHVLLADVRAFHDSAVALEAATAAAVAAGTPESLTAARDAWRVSMRLWQRIDAVQIGPAALPSLSAGGLGLRDEIYAWPLVSYCRIDQETVEPPHGDVALLRAENLNARGLAAMEYLLFNESPTNRCGVTHVINTSGSWAALGDAEVARRRLVYAHTASVLVVERALELRNAWEPSGGNFAGALSTAGAGSPIYATAQAGLNALSDSLFYLYKEVTDDKIGIPAGLRIECPAATCPDSVESPFAGASLDHIRANVEAFRDVYLGAPIGTDAPGIDDLLLSIGAGDLDARFFAAWNALFAQLAVVPPPLELAVDTDHGSVATLMTLTRELADLHKVELITVLDLELPNRLEGDMD